jgi:imidazolonepropionase-like amidohydrolase
VAVTLFTDVRIFDGSGDALFAGEVRVEGERIAALARGGERLDRAGATVVEGGGATLMPGLIEAHAHLGFASCVDRPPAFGPMLPEPERTAATTHAGAVLLDYGFTSAYSAGALDAALEVRLRDQFASGELPGPRLRACSFEKDGAAGAHGGPGAFEGAHVRQPDVEGMRTWAESMADMGLDSLKVVLSGESGLRPGTSRIVQFYDEELAACSEAAHRRGLWLNGHCHATDAIKQALRHGIRVLYHCTWADEEAIDMMEAKKDEIFVAPAPGINWANLHEGEAFGITREVAQAQEQDITLERVCELIPKLKKRGVRILPGGDYGFPWNPIGKNARDLKLFVDLFGYTPAEALSAATKLGGQIMGMGEELGQVRQGYLADLLLVNGDPTRDVAILQDKNRIQAVMKAGQFHRAPSQPAVRQIHA